MRWLKPILIVCLTLSLPALIAPPARAEPLKIRQGWVSLTTILMPMVFEKKDILKHYGTSYVLEPTHFASSSAGLTALATGDVDIVIGGPITLANAVENARMSDIRVVADGFQDGVDDYFSSSYVVRNDSGIKTIKDLKGKVLTTNGYAGTYDVVLRAALARAGLVDKKDYTIIEAEFASMNSMLLAHKVDLICSSPPFIYDPKAEAAAHVLFHMKDIVGPSQMSILMARTGFLDKNHAALVDFFEDYLRGIHWFLDPANRAEMLTIVARMTKQPVERFSSYLYTKADYYHAPNALPNLASMQHDIETLRSLGFVKSELDVKKYAELSLAQEAAQRLK